MLNFQKESNKEALTLADKDPIKAYLFGDDNDPAKTKLFVNLLNKHKIKVYSNQKDITKDNIQYKGNKSYIVPLKQIQYRLIKTIFETVSTFSDSTFYDISTWTIPITYDIPYSKLGSLKDIQQSSDEIHTQKIDGTIIEGESDIAYLFKWDNFLAPEALYKIQSAGLRTKVATQKTTFNIDGKDEKFTYGTIEIPVTDQNLDKKQIYDLVTSVAKSTGINFYGMKTGLASSGINLGSNDFKSLKLPKVLMFIAGSTSSSNAGEIWQMFDQRFKIPVCLSETDYLKSIDLNSYTTIILPNGSYREFSKTDILKIKTWIEAGGTLIAEKDAAAWAGKNGIGQVKFKKDIEKDTLNFSYANRAKENNINSISGIILNTEMDITHPLCYGYTRKNLAVFKTKKSIAEPLNEKYSEPVKFTPNSFISGCVSKKNIDQINNSPVVSIQSIGRGKLISFYESMTFRGFWLGTNKIFMNAVFFGDII